MDELFLSSFYSSATENLLNKKFYNREDNYEDLILEYVRNVISIPLSDYLDYLLRNPQNTYVTSEHITQCSHIELCHIELCEAFKRAEYRGLSLCEIGQYLHNDGVVRAKGTEAKYGENVKGAKQFGLAYCREGKWFLSAVGSVFHKLNEHDRLALLARCLLREPLYSQIMTEAVSKEVYLEDYMCVLTESTIIRRTPCVMAFCNIIVKQGLVEGKPIFYEINR